MELYYSGADAITIKNEGDTKDIFVFCRNPIFYASLLRYLTLLHRTTGAEIHLPKEIFEAAEATGFDKLFINKK